MRPRSTAQAQEAEEDRHPGAAEEASPAEDPAEADANIRSPRSCFQTNQDIFLAESHSRRRSGRSGKGTIITSYEETGRGRIFPDTSHIEHERGQPVKAALSHLLTVVVDLKFDRAEKA